MVAGDYTGTEELLSTCLQDGVFSQYLAKQQPRPAWTGLILPGECGDTAIAAESGAVQPGPAPRGGHQLVIDPLSQAAITITDPSYDPMIFQATQLVDVDVLFRIFTCSVDGTAAGTCPTSGSSVWRRGAGGC